MTVKGSLKKNTHLPVFSNKDVELSVSKWLTGARDRDGKRVERAKAEKRKREEATNEVVFEDV